jgi:uncharacterized phage-associated protein
MIEPKKTISAMDSFLLAEYIAFKGGPMSHLKLQKLLYYVQAYHLAYFDAPIIDDDFEAWVHGPVSRKIYDILKDKSVLHTEISYIQTKGEETPDKRISFLTSEQIELIDDIISDYGALTGLQLENISHSELPWIEARRGTAPADRCDNIISKEAMTSYYKNVIHGEAQA